MGRTASELELAEKEREALEAARVEATMERIRNRDAQKSAELRRLVKQLSAEMAVLQEDVEILSVAHDAHSKPLKIRRRAKSKDGKGNVVPIACASDWHIEERVEPAQVSGRNHHNLEIAREKCRRYFRNVAQLVKHEQTRSHVNEMVIWMGGDFMSGHIHPDLVEVTELSPSQCVPELMDIWMGGLRYWLSELDMASLHIVCSDGNHGRTTIKPRVSSGYRHSYEGIFYRMLANEMRNETRITFTIVEGYHNTVDISGFKVRFHHGDAIRYGGGIGGLHIPLRKRVSGWNAHDPSPPDLDILGHFHQKLDLEYAIVNGSLIGYAPYAVHIGASFEPPQQVLAMIDIDRKRKAGVYPVFVDAKG